MMMSNKKSVVVTGAGGFIGSRLVERLLQEDLKVLALSRTEGKLSNSINEKLLTFIPCDLGDFDELNRIILDFSPQFCYHFACHPDGKEDFQQIAYSIDQNLGLTVNILEAFTRCKTKELFIYGDSTKVYGDCGVPYTEALAPEPLNSYAIGKMAGWEYCKLYQRLFGTKSVAVRPTLTYGPHQAYNVTTYIVQCALKNLAKIELDGGSQTRDLLYIDDCVDAYLAVMQKKDVCAGHIINIGGGREISIHELAQNIINIMKSKSSVVSNKAKKRPTEINTSHCDNNEAKALLGWQPLVSLENGLEKTIDFLIHSHGHTKQNG